MAKERISGTRPRLQGKPWDWQTKRELQLFLDTLSLGTDQVQVDLGVLEAVVLSLIGTPTLPEGPVDPGLVVHPFLLMGA